MSRSLDILAIAMLPHRACGRRAFQYGGAIVDATLLRGLAAAGHRVRAIVEAPADGMLREGTPVPRVDADWFAIEYVSGRRAPSLAQIDRRRAALETALDRALLAGRPDVALLGREAQAWYAPPVLRAAGIPTVAVAQGNPTAGLDDAIYAPHEEAEFVVRLSDVDLVVAVGAHLEAALRARGIEAVTIPNVVDRDLFRPAEPDPAFRRRIGVEPEAPMIVHVCGLLPGKRWGDLIASAARVAEAMPDARYVVAGAEDELGAARDAAREHGVEDRFRWLGVVGRTTMPVLLNAADVMIHTSSREGAPLTYLEALACGVPIVATHIAPARAVLEDGVTGILYPAGDIDALTATTLALLADRPRRAALGRAARAACPDGDPADWAGRYADALASVAGMAVAVA